jgi:hypothetical protein
MTTKAQARKNLKKAAKNYKEKVRQPVTIEFDERHIPTLFEEGSVIEYKEHGCVHYGRVEKDSSFRGGLKCNGRSVSNIIDDAEYVEVIMIK